jgi:AraC-like DNA-binding protein
MSAPAQQQAGLISSRVVVRVVDFAAARGHDPEQLCRSVGISLGTLRDPDTRLPFALAERLGMRVAELCNDANIGLHLAQDVRDPRVFDAGILLMMASPTLGASFERMERFQRFWADGERFVRRPTPTGLCLRSIKQDALGDYQRHSDECAMAEFVLGARVLTEREIAPQIVRFRHAAPSDTREHEALFRCPLEFGAEYAEVELDQAVLDLPLPHANETYLAIFQQQVERALARLPAPSGIAASVRAAARAALSSGDCSLEGTARVLGISPRTMQRKLRSEGTSFAELIDALRREMAAAYLDKQVPVPEIAWLLGYAEPSAFHHAFKRWTGTTPEQLRAARDARATDE